jgi:hypothetical protein
MTVPITVVVTPRAREVLDDLFWAEGAMFLSDQTTAMLV